MSFMVESPLKAIHESRYYLATNRAILSILDYYKKKGTTRVNVPVVTAGNFTAQAGLFNTLQGAIVAVSTGTLVEAYVDAMLYTAAAIPPTDQTSTRASKWLVRAVDTTNAKAVTFTIASAEQTLLSGNSPFLDITTVASPGKNLKDAIEAYVLSEDGNAITVNSVEYVPRSN